VADTIWLTDGPPTVSTLANVYDVGDQVPLRAIVVALETRGSIASGSNLLTVADATGYATSDPIAVRRAGPLGSDLLTTISSISGSVLTLAATASTTVNRQPVGKRLAATVTASVEKPDGTNATPTLTPSSTGVYEGSYAPDAKGDYYVRVAATGAAVAADELLFVVRERRVN